MEKFIKIFNSQDETEIKQAFKEIIIECFRSDLAENERYIFDPDNIAEIVREAFEEATNEVKQEYKEKLRESISTLSNKDFEKIIKNKK